MNNQFNLQNKTNTFHLPLFEGALPEQAAGENYKCNINFLSEEPLLNAIQSSTFTHNFLSIRQRITSLSESTELPINIHSLLKLTDQIVMRFEKLFFQCNTDSSSSYHDFDSNILLAFYEFKKIQGQWNEASVRKAVELMQTPKDLQCELIELRDTIRKAFTGDDAELEKFGKKHMNLIKLARIFAILGLTKATVPLPRGISSDQVHSFLNAVAPEVFTLWKQLTSIYSADKGNATFLEQPEPAKILHTIKSTVKSAFEKAGTDDSTFEKLGLSNDLLEWIQERKVAGHYLMVRSTGAEDSCQTANAGGNISKSYVIPEKMKFCTALGKVAASYFGYASLQNRINAQENPFESDLKLAVTAQELIGEPIGGSSDGKEIPVSLVLFSNEPLYIGNESFRVMRLSATLGHGEGVVGNQGISCDTALILISQVDPSKLYIVYDNKAKHERLAPLLNEQGKVILAKIDNPASLIYKPVLTNQQIRDLYLTGIITEKYFDNHPSDMEIVIKKDQIYVVQARPINRPLLLPTYLDLRKVAELPSSPIVKNSQADMIVPGKASVVIASNAEEVLFARTLEEAEKKFAKDKHKIVLVCKDEPANSHPVVNFSGLGMPCLFLPEGEAVEKMLKQIDSDHLLVVCVQSSTLNLWDNRTGKIEECVSEGFAVHPAKIMMSLPIEKAPPMAETNPKVSQDVKNALLEIRSAITSEVALKNLQELGQQEFVTGIKAKKKNLKDQIRKIEESGKFVQAKATDALATIKEIKKAVDCAFEQTAAAFADIDKGDKLKPLLHVKILEAVLISTPKNNGSVGQYSALDIEPILEATQELIDYQSGLGHVAHFGDILLAGSKAMHQDTKIEWTAFLNKLEPLVEKGEILKEKAHSLNKMIALLENLGVLSAWMTLFFPSSYSLTYSPSENLDLLLNDLPEGQIDSVPLLLKEKAALQSFRGRMDDLADPKTFEKAWEELQRIVKHFTIKSETVMMKELLTESAPLVRMMALETMKELVDVFDCSIKSMKSSSRWSDNDKVLRFEKMLQPYNDLLQDWGKNLIDTSTIPVHKNWSCAIYLKAIKLNKFSSKPSELNPSPNFSVAAAVLGSTTEFLRHLPNTLEDWFTLYHQNLLMFISNLNNQLCQQSLLKKAGFPLLIKEGIESINSSNLGRNIQKTGINISDKGIEINYNVPLANHSGQIILQYDKETENVLLKAQFFGVDFGRWEHVKLRASILDKAAFLRLTEPVYHISHEVSFSWKINSINELKIALKEYNSMAGVSCGSAGVDDLDTLLFQNDIISDKYQLSDFMEDLQQMIIKDAESDLSFIAYFELEKLVSDEKFKKYSDQGICEKFISFIQREILNPQPKIREIAFLLLTKLCKIGCGIPEAIIICDEWHDDKKTEKLWIYLYCELVIKGYSLEKASLIIDERINSIDRELQSSYISLLCELILQDRQIANGIIIAEKYFLDVYSQSDDLSFKLWATLLKRDQGFDQAISLAKSSKNIKLWDLILSLGKGKGVDEALILAEKECASDIEDEQYNGIRLCRLLVKNKFGINTAIHLAKNITNDNLKFYAYQLWNELVAIGAVEGPFNT